MGFNPTQVECEHCFEVFEGESPGQNCDVCGHDPCTQCDQTKVCSKCPARFCEDCEGDEDGVCYNCDEDETFEEEE